MPEHAMHMMKDGKKMADKDMPHKKKVYPMERKHRLSEEGEYEEAPPKPRMLRRMKK